MQLATFMPWLDVRKARSAGDTAEIERLLAAYDKLEPRVRRAFMAAIETLSGHVDVEQVASLLRHGRVVEALAVIDTSAIAMGVRPVSAALTQGLIDAARAAVKRIPAPSTFEVTFNVTNPRTIEYLRQYEFGLVRELTTEARASVAEAIRQGVEAGRNPLDTARDVRQFIGLTRRQTAAVLNYRRLLTQQSPEALARALRDRRFDSALRASIQQGVPLSPDKIERMTQRYRERYLKHRAETIARTESIRAVNIGNLAGWRQAVADGTIAEAAVRRFWVYTKDNKTRPAHRRIPGMNSKGVGLEEAFQTPDGPMMHPGDPAAPAAATVNCRCTQIIRYVASSRDDDVALARE